jgi:hypothetical protein
MNQVHLMFLIQALFIIAAPVAAYMLGLMRAKQNQSA